VGDPKLFTGVDPSTFPTKPLAVEQVGTSELGAHPRETQLRDRFAVEPLGGGTVAEQGP
jgi:hypothetical protein